MAKKTSHIKIAKVEEPEPAKEKTPKKQTGKSTTTTKAKAKSPAAKQSTGKAEKSTSKSTAKGKAKSKATSAQQPATVAEPTRDEIAARAYDLYLQRGRAPGDPVEDWLQAERELRAERE